MDDGWNFVRRNELDGGREVGGTPGKFFLSFAIIAVVAVCLSVRPAKSGYIEKLVIESESFCFAVAFLV